MKSHSNLYDLVLKDGWVIDSSQSLNGCFDVAVMDGKIAAVSHQLPSYLAKQTISVNNCLICPGFIDLHTHVYEWATHFGLAADEAGIHSGVTTVVDQGSCGSLTFPDFRSKIIEPAKTDVRCFPLVNHAPDEIIGNAVSGLQNPEKVDKEALIELAQENSKVIRGFKVYGESGSISRWGMDVFKLAREVGDRTGLPIYMHTGELFPVVEANRPNPDQVVENLLSYMQAGDILAHCYSCQPDGVMGMRTQVPPSLRAAIERGVLLDLGHGLNFSFDIARRMMEQGVLPHTISSDVHGDFDTLHNDSTLNYSLCGALSKLMALGLDLTSAIAMVTINPARILKAEAEIGTLKIGSRADLTILQFIDGEWLFYDSLGKHVIAQQKLVPVWVVRSGELIQPHRRLLRDLEEQNSSQSPVVGAGLPRPY